MWANKILGCFFMPTIRLINGTRGNRGPYGWGYIITTICTSFLFGTHICCWYLPTFGKWWADHQICGAKTELTGGYRRAYKNEPVFVCPPRQAQNGPNFAFSTQFCFTPSNAAFISPPLPHYMAVRRYQQRLWGQNRCDVYIFIVICPHP